MPLDLNGKHLIAGDWVGGAANFTSAPASGAPRAFAAGTDLDVERAVAAAEAAFERFAGLDRTTRAIFLDRIADEIEARGDAITEIGCEETGLPAARLQGERARTTGQLRLFAREIENGDHLDRRHDAALPDRQPLPRPDLRLMQQPVGPVAVFGASNFPLAFSTAGGDTASALAAGCPVVVKGHPAHPGTAEVVATAIAAAADACAMPAGVFSLIQSDGIDVGQALVRHPLIRAVGFTGSLRAGRALFDLCVARPEPIPFFGELGSINPVFVLPAALRARGADIGRGWAASLTMGVGQFCTNPGVLIVPMGAEGDGLIDAASAALGAVAEQTMLTEGIAAGYRVGRDRLAGLAMIESVIASSSTGRAAGPDLLTCDAATWLATPDMAHEVFGPLGIVVRAAGIEQMHDIARALEGQLTATLQIDEADTVAAQALMPILARKAGRVIANGFPTGVEVAAAMVHGGPYPASTNFGATSVGTMAIRRWLRPVCYQDIPAALLPGDLR
ncbi:MAG: aldehyde dehydrogenase (NADP(+)) [Pseudomonadota bacterium]